MPSINLRRLNDILKSVTNLRDYRSARAFLQDKIFTAENDKKANCVFVGDDNAESWMDLTDSNVISELTRAKLNRHLCATKITYAVTKLIIYHYNGVLKDIEHNIAQDLAPLDNEKLDCLAAELNALQANGELPLLNDLKINRDNLAQVIVACALHCFYIEGADIRKLGNAYSKNTIIALRNSKVTQEDFERDFPAYVFKMSWDELAITKDCKYTHCERCKHSCAQLRSNYNVEQLLKLYLKSNVKTEQAEEQPLDKKTVTDNSGKTYITEKAVVTNETDAIDEIVSQDDLSVLNAMIDTLGAEGLSIMLKAVINTKMSTGEKMQLAFDLMMKEKEKNGRNKK